jgi:quercetin dioxygenase-like cupin family protein
MFPAFRRVTTKRMPDGRSVLAEDSSVNIDDLGLADFWTTSTMPARCDEFVGFGEDRPRLEPPASGTIFRYFVIPHCQLDTRRHPAMHTTRTIDYVVLLRGSVSLLLDEGEEIPVRPLDVVVQRGTNHYWVNRGSEPALLMGVLVDAVF